MTDSEKISILENIVTDIATAIIPELPGRILRKPEIKKIKSDIERLKNGK